MELGPEEILLLVSRDPDKTASRLADVRARREEEARRRVAEDASRMLRGTNARFRKAERTEDPSEAARLRLEGEERLKDLAAVDLAAWPWARWMYPVRDTDLLVPAGGEAPVYEGLRITIPSPWDPERLQHAEFGRVKGSAIGVREAGSATWSERALEKVVEVGIRPEHLDQPWPAEDLAASVAARLDTALRYGGNWPALGWTWASDAWLERVWAAHGGEVVSLLAKATSWYAEQQRVPIVDGDELRIARGVQIAAAPVLPPTVAGWRELLRLAPASRLKFGELDEVATYWWDRRVPRGLLSRESPREAA